MDTSNKKIISESLARRMLHCVEEYEKIKRKESERFQYVKDFCHYFGFSHQNFMKIYHRYKQNPEISSLLPQKRGPRFKSRRTDLRIEQRVFCLREQGLNRYEIVEILKTENIIISPSTIYNISKRYKINRLHQPQKQNKRKIIMERMGQLAHIDCHNLSRGMLIDSPNKDLYLLGVIDDYSRLAWIELIENKKSLTVMFATMRALQMLRSRYGIEVESIMSDNGAEFGGGKDKKNKEDNPFERLLLEMGIKHIYTKPYCPQTNGKIERFWKTLNEDLVEDTLLDNIEELKQNILEYNIYYNELRPHSTLNGKTPKNFSSKCN